MKTIRQTEPAYLPEPLPEPPKPKPTAERPIYDGDSNRLQGTITLDVDPATGLDRGRHLSGDSHQDFHHRAGAEEVLRAGISQEGFGFATRHGPTSAPAESKLMGGHCAAASQWRAGFRSLGARCL